MRALPCRRGATSRPTGVRRGQHVMHGNGLNVFLSPHSVIFCMYWQFALILSYFLSIHLACKKINRIKVRCAAVCRCCRLIGPAVDTWVVSGVGWTAWFLLAEHETSICLAAARRKSSLTEFRSAAAPRWTGGELHLFLCRQGEAGYPGDPGLPGVMGFPGREGHLGSAGEKVKFFYNYYCYYAAI